MNELLLKTSSGREPEIGRPLKEYLNHRGTKMRVFRVCFRAPLLPPFFTGFSPLIPLQALFSPVSPPLHPPLFDSRKTPIEVPLWIRSKKPLTRFSKPAWGPQKERLEEELAEKVGKGLAKDWRRVGTGLAGFLAPSNAAIPEAPVYMERKKPIKKNQIKEFGGRMPRRRPRDKLGTSQGHLGHWAWFMCKSILKGQNVPGTDGTYHGTDGTCPRDRRDAHQGVSRQNCLCLLVFFFPQFRRAGLWLQWHGRGRYSASC